MRDGGLWTWACVEFLKRWDGDGMVMEMAREIDIHYARLRSCTMGNDGGVGIPFSSRS